MSTHSSLARLAYTKSIFHEGVGIDEMDFTYTDS